MKVWKTLVLGVILCIILWMLYPAASTPEPAGEQDVVEIVYMGPGGPLIGPTADAVSEFERQSREAHQRDPAHPVYRVISGQNASPDQTGDPTRFLISVAGGLPPDVIFFDRYAIIEWAYRGAFTPLDDSIRRDEAAGATDVPKPQSFFKAAWNEAVFDGKLYGIPSSMDNRALYYNKSLLKRAGLVNEHGEARPPRDWDELLEYSIKLTERDAQGRLKTVGFAPLYGNSWLYMFGWMNGGEFMSADGRTCTLNEPRVVEALEYMRQVYDSIGGMAEVNGFQAGFAGQAAQLDPFIQSKIAMKVDGYFTLQLIAAYGPNLDFGVAPPPVSKRLIARGQHTTSWSGGWAYAIPSGARQKDAAWAFIKFMVSREATLIMAESEREVREAQGEPYVPAQSPQAALNDELYRRYILTSPRLSERVKHAAKVFNDLLPVSHYRPATPVGQLLWNEQNNATEAALYHTLTPQQALDQGAAIVQRDLHRVMNPPTGPQLHWSWFAIIYAVLLVLCGVLVYWWDTRLGFRRWMASALGMRSAADNVIEGGEHRRFRRQWIGGLICASPWIIGFIIFGGGPMLYSLLMSFCDYDILNPPHVIGGQNYAWMVTQDNLLPTALLNTLFMVIGVPLGMAVSLLLAMLLNLRVRGIAVWRTLFYMPAIVPMVASSILWIWILNPEGGLVNLLLRSMGLEGPLWLQSRNWSKPSLILMGLWGAGGGMIIWLAGLKGINAELYEAASLDGANAWQRLRHVTIPQLTPYIFFNLVMGLIAVFQIFGQAFIMTRGGPANSTLFYVYHLFNNAFRYGHMGYASAMAWVLFVIVLALTVFQLKFSKRWVHYETE